MCLLNRQYRVGFELINIRRFTTSQSVLLFQLHFVKTLFDHTIQDPEFSRFTYLFTSLLWKMFQKVFYFMVLLFYIILWLVDPSSNGEPPSDEILQAIKNLPPQFDDKKQAVKLDSRQLEFIKSIFKSGFKSGFKTGFKTGYENRSAEYFYSMFECAINHGKVTLEVYKDYQYIFSKCERDVDAINKIELPDDIWNLTVQNDAWIMEYENKKISNGHFTTTAKPEDTPRILKRATVLVDIEKQLRHWYCIVNCTEENMRVLDKKFNKKSSKSNAKSWKWNPTPFTMPPFIIKLKQQLKHIQLLNPNIYGSKHEIFLRFSAHSGRTYKMFCTIHRKLMKYIYQMAKNNQTIQFSDILFYYTPTWIMTTEQLFFYNVVRRTLDPTSAPIKNFTISNADPRGSKSTLIPYDDSEKCSQVIIKTKGEVTETYIADCTLPAVVV